MEIGNVGRAWMKFEKGKSFKRSLGGAWTRLENRRICHNEYCHCLMIENLGRAWIRFGERVFESKTGIARKSL